MKQPQRQKAKQGIGLSWAVALLLLWLHLAIWGGAAGRTPHANPLFSADSAAHAACFCAMCKGGLKKSCCCAAKSGGAVCALTERCDGAVSPDALVSAILPPVVLPSLTARPPTPLAKRLSPRIPLLYPCSVRGRTPVPPHAPPRNLS